MHFYNFAFIEESIDVSRISQIRVAGSGTTPRNSSAQAQRSRRLDVPGNPDISGQRSSSKGSLQLDSASGGLPREHSKRGSTHKLSIHSIRLSDTSHTEAWNVPDRSMIENPARAKPPACVEMRYPIMKEVGSPTSKTTAASQFDHCCVPSQAKLELLESEPSDRPIPLARILIEHEDATSTHRSHSKSISKSMAPNFLCENTVSGFLNVQNETVCRQSQSNTHIDTNLDFEAELRKFDGFHQYLLDKYGAGEKPKLVKHTTLEGSGATPVSMTHVFRNKFSEAKEKRSMTGYL